ncbi:MAG: T9SS type A sorting domain-containing protein, partial [bacterium]
HGTAAPMLLFGKPVAGGVFGAHPDLSDLQNGDLKHRFDFRQIYATLLEQWLGADSASILGSAFGQLNFIDPTTGIGSNGSQPKDFYLLQSYPNPFNPTTTIEYGLPQSAEIEISVYNALGRKVETVLKGRQAAGVHRVIWNANGHASGQYYLHLRGRGIALKRKMQLVK